MVKNVIFWQGVKEHFYRLVFYRLHQAMQWLSADMLWRKTLNCEEPRGETPTLKGRGCLSEIFSLRGTKILHRGRILKFFSPLWGTNSKTTIKISCHFIFGSILTERYRNSPRRVPFEAKHLTRYQNRVLTPKRYDERAPVLFIWEPPPPPPPPSLRPLFFPPKKKRKATLPQKII